MPQFDQYIQYRALAFKYETLKSGVISSAIEQMIEKMPKNGLDADGLKLPPLKNVCAKVSVSLSERLDNTTSTLGISKRQFIEMALIEALDRADEIMGDVGIDEALEEAGQ